MNTPQKPRLVSSITTLDTTYLTIIVSKFDSGNLGKLEEKIIKMCKEDTFENIKLWTADRKMTKKWYISVYSSEEDLEMGNICLTIKYGEGK